MAAITPSTNLKLLKNPNNLSNQNQLTFANATAQYNYFNSLTKLEVDDFTYQRKDYVIRYNACIDDILDYNYCMYQNEAYDNKWFYAFIVNMRYINDNVTEITIKTDVFQSFQFDLTYKACFVEREHVNDDTIGLHTVPEGLETGDYINQPGTESATQTRDLFYLANPYIVVALTEIPNFVMPAAPNGRMYNGVYSGLYYLVFNSARQLDLFITGLQSIITEDVIYSIFMIPKNIVTIGTSDWGTYTIGGTSCEFAFYPFTDSSTIMGEVGFNKETYLDNNYVPRNKKLLCYPYRYLLLSNNSGSVQEYKYELFSDSNTCPFIIKGAVSPGCAIKIIPQNYKSGDRIYGLDAGKLPTCSWTNDSYTNWLTQNAVNIPLNNIKNIGAIIGGVTMIAATGGMGAVAGAGLVASGISGVADSLKNIYEHSLAPETAKGGANQGDLNFADHMPFSYYKMSIKEEYATMIDKYFDIYGYKVNSVKIPNITGRSNWNYVKTIGANIEGLIPEYYLNEIKGLFDAGITLWHTTQYFLDYSRSNNII